VNRYIIVVGRRIAPIDASDAAGMNLYNISEKKWDEDILAVVMGDGDENNGETGGQRLEQLLGEVETDASKPVSLDTLHSSHLQFRFHLSWVKYQNILSNDTNSTHLA
jgi:hypothetical protein